MKKTRWLAMSALALGLALASANEADRALEAVVNDPAHPLASLSVAAIKDGKIVYARAFGSRFIDVQNPANNKPANTSTRYRVASLSKMVTALGLMRLYDAGKVELDRDLSDYLGWSFRNPNFPDQPITLQMLLSHTSGIKDDAGYSYPPDVALKDVFTPGGAQYGEGKMWAKDHAPGTFFQYANFNFGVIATVIERVSGVRFDRYMRNNVLTPLGMGGSYNPATLSSSKLGNLATLYRKRGPDNKWDTKGPWYPQVDDYSQNPPADLGTNYVIGTNGTVFSPQGGLRASATELAQIALMFLNDGAVNGKAFLEPSTVDLMLADHWTYNAAAKNGDNYFGLFRSWGLGVQRFTDSSDKDGGDRIVASGGVRGFGHLGEAYGLLSGLIFDPETRTGMVYLIGGQGSNPDDYFGKYSTFYGWEERILTGLYDNIVK